MTPALADPADSAVVPARDASATSAPLIPLVSKHAWSPRDAFRQVVLVLSQPEYAVHGSKLDVSDGGHQSLLVRAQQAVWQWLMSGGLLDAAMSLPATKGWFETYQQVEDSGGAQAIARNVVFAEAFESLDRYAEYGANWDSYGAAAIAPLAISTARSLLWRVLRAFPSVSTDRIKPSHVAPLRNGGVQIEWEYQDIAFEVEVATGGGLSYLLVRGEKPSWQFETARDVSGEQILHILGRVTGANVGV